MDIQVGNVFTFNSYATGGMVGLITRIEPRTNDDLFYFDELSNGGWMVKCFTKDSMMHKELEVISQQLTPLVKILYL